MGGEFFIERKHMEIVYKKIHDLKPYANNPRFNDDAVQYVANSIKEFGFKVPIIIDKNNEIVAGHTRYKASIELELDEVPCIVADDLTDEQVKAFRLADNKVSEFSSWNFDFLDEELEGLAYDFDMTDFGFPDMSLDLPDEEEESEKYTRKVEIPQYEITGDEPKISDLVYKAKADELLEEIEKADITEEQKEFLRMSAYRHYAFNYSEIAEYYAHQDKTMQELMEKSALVIIDYDDAIRYGYAELRRNILEQADDDYDE